MLLLGGTLEPSSLALLVGYQGEGRVSVVDRRDGYQGGGRLEINDTIGIVQGGIMLR